MSDLVAIVTQCNAAAVASVLGACREAATAGQSVRVFFRDESIPALCRPDVTARLVEPGIVSPTLQAMLDELAATGDVRLYACSSSLYLWGVSVEEMLPAVFGSRGLIAFLVEDLAGATRVMTC
ncbi:MAG: DrsE protein [Chloroflexi bacterium]|nr:DrsE protein [Chloroflexota bacterium]